MLQTTQYDISIDKVFTMLWCIWKARNDYLFNKKSWSVSQVHHSVFALLSSVVQEHTMLQETHVLTAPEAVPTDAVHVPPVASLHAGPIAFSDAAYNPAVAGDMAAIGVYLQHPARKLSIYIQAISISAKSALQAEAQAIYLAAFAARTVLEKCLFLL